MTNADALKNAKIRRHLLLESVGKLIKEDEHLKASPNIISWSEIGSIERQCDLIQRLQQEVEKQRQIK